CLGTPEPWRLEQGHCTPAWDEGRHRQSSRAPHPAQVRPDEPHAGRCCLRERPAKVLPAPGTPVTKQMALYFFAVASSMIWAMQSAVCLRLMAPASDLVISSTR